MNMLPARHKARPFRYITCQLIRNDFSCIFSVKTSCFETLSSFLKFNQVIQIEREFVSVLVGNSRNGDAFCLGYLVLMQLQKLDVP